MILVVINLHRKRLFTLVINLIKIRQIKVKHGSCVNINITLYVMNNFFNKYLVRAKVSMLSHDFSNYILN